MAVTATKFTFPYATGLATFIGVRILDAAGSAINASGGTADASPTTGEWANYRVTVTELASGFYQYIWTVPASMPAGARYHAVALLEVAAGTPAATDVPIWEWEFDWDGAAIVTEADVIKLLGTAWLTPGTAGTPDVNAKLLGGTAQTAKDVGAINVTNLNTLSGHDPGATLGTGTSTLTQTQVTGGAYSVQSSSCVLGDARVANLDATVSSRLASVSYTSPPTANANADALLDRTDGIETGWTLRKILRVIAASVCGKVSGAGSNAPVFRDVTDAKARVTAVTDNDGNRSSVTLDGT